MKKHALTFGILFAFASMSINHACFAAMQDMSVTMPAAMVRADDIRGNWNWIGSDGKYGKYIDPKMVKVVKTADTYNGSVPTRIIAWTKTTYTHEAAAETVQSYGISDIITVPDKLAFSYGLVEVDPQMRTLQYQKEVFFDEDGNVIWASDTPGRLKEINSQEFDEAFYGAVVDTVFRMGEVARMNAKDRWITLCERELASGSKYKVTADTSTMRLRGDKLIVLTWTELTDESGSVKSTVFLKKSVDLQSESEMVVSGKIWEAGSGWKEYADPNGGAYAVIDRSSEEYKGFARLAAFARGYSMWVNRYRVE